MEKSSLIKFSTNQLQKAANAIAITNKLLQKVATALIPYKKGEKWGFCTPEKNIVIECIYDYTVAFADGLAAVKKGGKCGFVDINGNNVIPCIYDDLENFSEGLAIVSKNGKHGIISKDGNIVVPCVYDSINTFSKGLGRVKNNDKYGFINKDGSILIPLDYDYLDDFSEGLAAARNDDKCGFINVNGEVIIPFIYKHVLSFRNGLAGVNRNNKATSVINTETVAKGLKLMEIYAKSGILKFQEIAEDLADDLGDRLTEVWEALKVAYGAYAANATDEEIEQMETLSIVRKYKIDDFINKPFRASSEYNDVDENTSTGALEDDKWGFINKSGSIIIPCIYDVLDSFYDGLAFVLKDKSFGQLSLFGFEYGVLTDVEKDSEGGFIDIHGNLIIPCEFEKVARFSEGRAGIKKNGKYGFIDRNGIIVIACEYNFIGKFSEGLAIVEKDGKYGFVDYMGNIVIPCIYSGVNSFSGGLAGVYNNKISEFTGFINKENVQYWED